MKLSKHTTSAIPAKRTKARPVNVCSQKKRMGMADWRSMGSDTVIRGVICGVAMVESCGDASLVKNWICQ